MVPYKYCNFQFWHKLLCHIGGGSYKLLVKLIVSNTENKYLNNILFQDQNISYYIQYYLKKYKLLLSELTLEPD
jgi:hypothetical protein